MACLVTRPTRGSEVSLRCGKPKGFKHTWVNISAVYLSMPGPNAHKDLTDIISARIDYREAYEKGLVKRTP